MQNADRQKASASEAINLIKVYVYELRIFRIDVMLTMSLLYFKLY